MLIALLFLCIVLLCVAVLFRSGGRLQDDGDRPSMFSRIAAVFRRFPFAMAASILGTTAGVVLVGDRASSSSIWTKLLAIALLVLPLLVVSRLLSEKHGRQGSRLDPLTAGIVTLGGVYFLLMGDLHDYGVWYRHALWTIAAFLILLFFPFYRRSEAEEAWHFNAAMAHAFSIAFTWAFALFAGVAAALAGVDYLLAIEVSGESYPRLWVVMAGFVAVVIFLSTLPTDIRRMSPRPVRPKAFEGFLRFVLVPLVSLYLIILYLYAARIIFLGSWPKGGVAGFILGFSGVGIATYLLGYGLSLAENRWMALYRKFFFPLVLPLTPLLFLSVWRRISTYGVTETRYFGIVAAFWLAAVSLYYIVSRRKDLRIVPASLCLIAILVSFGPWGALSTAARSQTGRLQKLLQDAGILVNGTLLPVTKIAKSRAVAEINQSVVYLHNTGNIAPLTVWSAGKITGKDLPEAIAAKLGIPFTLQDDSSASCFNFSAKPAEETDIADYRYLWGIDIDRHNTQELPFNVGDAPVLKIKPEDGLQKLEISVVGKKTEQIDVAAFAEKLLKEFPVDSNCGALPTVKMITDLPQSRVRLVFSEIHGSSTDGKPMVNYIKGVVMWGGK